MTASPAPKKGRAARAPKKQTMSTSEGRANFAEALGMAQEESTVIGIDRYGKPVAAVVPVDAVRILAGYEHEVAPAVRDKIARMSRIFLQGLSPPEAQVDDGVKEARVAFEPKPKEKGRGRKEKKAQKNRRQKKNRKKSQKKNRKKSARPALRKPVRRVAPKI